MAHLNLSTWPPNYLHAGANAGSPEGSSLWGRGNTCNKLTSVTGPCPVPLLSYLSRESTVHPFWSSYAGGGKDNESAAVANSKVLDTAELRRRRGGIILTPTVDPPGQGGWGNPRREASWLGYRWTARWLYGSIGHKADTARPATPRGGLGRTKSPLCATPGCPHVSFPHLSMRQSWARVKTIRPLPQPLSVVFLG